MSRRPKSENSSIVFWEKFTTFLQDILYYIFQANTTIQIHHKTKHKNPAKMDQESNQMEQHPVLCRNGCGFYSNNGTDGLCSVCYKDMIKKKQQPPTNMPASLVPNPAPGTMASLSIDESSSEASSPAKNSSVDTALPTVILPSSQTDKV